MKSEASKKADIVQKAINGILKEAGFVRKGRNYNRKTADGLTQVVTVFVYKKYPTDPTIMNIEVGIIVPEVCRFNFDSTEKPEKFFATSSCWVFRSDIGRFKGIQDYRGYNSFHYYLDKGDTQFLDEVSDIISDVCDVLKREILPMFDDLISRDKIITNAEKYPIIQGRLNFAKACIYGARGELDKARACCDWTSDRWLEDKAKQLGLI